MSSRIMETIENIYAEKVNSGNLLWIPALAGRICYSSKPVEELITEDERITTKNLSYLKKLIDMGHLSIFEHLVIPITKLELTSKLTKELSLYDLIGEIDEEFKFLFDVIGVDIHQMFPVLNPEKELSGFFKSIVLALKSKFHILPYTDNSVIINLRHLLEYKYRELGDWKEVGSWFVEKFGNAIPPEDWRPQLITTAEINDGQGKLHLVRIVTDESKVVGITFIVEGCSRVMTHQLVRHRLFCSYSQRSHRHTKVKDETEFVYPPLDYIKLKKVRKQLHELFKESYKQSLDNYRLLTEDGILHKEEKFVVRKEDARFIIPDGVKTTIMVTMLTDGYRNFIKERIEQGTQWEIREIAERLSGFLPEFRDK